VYFGVLGVVVVVGAFESLGVLVHRGLLVTRMFGLKYSCLLGCVGGQHEGQGRGDEVVIMLSQSERMPPFAEWNVRSNKQKGKGRTEPTLLQLTPLNGCFHAWQSSC
jgi:hypothetical protein